MRAFDILEEFKGLIIDVHAHIGCDQRFLFRLSDEEIVKVYDKYGIAKGFVSSISSLTSDYKKGNLEVLEAVRKYPNRIIGLVAANPYYGEEAIREVEKYVREYGFRGVKFHPFYFKIEPSEPLSLKLLEKVSRLRIPLMLHSYDGGVEAVKVANNLPNLTIIAYHCGGVRWLEALRRFKKYDNIYVEISSSIADRGFIKKAVEVLGSERIFFGTDVPYIEPAVCFGKVLEADLPRRDYENIFYKNAEEVLGVKP